MFYVGEKVLLFDPVENAGEKILKAISEVTKLPVTTIVYSHAHADHISSARLCCTNLSVKGFSAI